MKQAGEIAKYVGLLDLLQDQQRGNEVELAFLARQLVQVTLPHSDPGDVPVWTRRNGDLTLIMTRADIDGDGNLIGYPFGSLPRLLLYWINSEAVRTKSRRLELGRNLSQFMSELGLNPRNGRGERSDAKRLQGQMLRLFSASIRFRRTTEVANGDIRERMRNVPIIEESELWWNPKHSRQGYLWDSWIELSESFYNTITAIPVPLNMRVLRALKRSPLALDLFAWVSYRSWTVTRHKAPQEVSWKLLHAQLGADYTELRNFKLKASAALRKIVIFQPEFRVSLSGTGVQIRPCAPVIEAKPLYL